MTVYVTIVACLNYIYRCTKYFCRGTLRHYVVVPSIESIQVRQANGAGHPYPRVATKAAIYEYCTVDGMVGEQRHTAW